MQYYIREWYDRSASLIAEDGYTLNTYPTVNEAVTACIEHCRTEPLFIERFNEFPTLSIEESYLSTSALEYCN